MKHMLRTSVLALVLASPALAQDRAQTLADVRQELTVLSVELQRLKGELNTTGAPAGVSGNTVLDRMNAIEQALMGLTAKTEELEFRLNSVATDGANRVGDLSFRLCELEPDCDIMNEGMSKPLGGEVAGASGTMTAPATPSPSTDTSLQLAVGEQADFDGAVALLDGGDFASAAEKLQLFVSNYPGSPMTGQAHFLRGEAMAALGQTADAARAYLASFSAEPQGTSSASALLQLGISLGTLGQTAEACATLGEVSNRFPGSTEAAEAQGARSTLGCL